MCVLTVDCLLPKSHECLDQQQQKGDMTVFSQEKASAASLVENRRLGRNPVGWSLNLFLYCCLSKHAYVLCVDCSR